jgi:hypothetical protein
MIEMLLSSPCTIATKFVRILHNFDWQRRKKIVTIPSSTLHSNAGWKNRKNCAFCVDIQIDFLMAQLA